MGMLTVRTMFAWTQLDAVCRYQRWGPYTRSETEAVVRAILSDETGHMWIAIVPDGLDRGGDLAQREHGQSRGARERAPVLGRRVDIRVADPRDIACASGIQECRLEDPAALEVEGEDAGDLVGVVACAPFHRCREAGVESSPPGM